MHNRKALFGSKSETERHPRQKRRPGWLLVLPAFLGAAAGAYAVVPEEFRLHVIAAAGAAGLVLLILLLRGLFYSPSGEVSTSLQSRKEDSEELEKIVQSTPHPILITDPGGKTLIANKWFRDMFDISPDEDFFVLNDPRTRPWNLEDVFPRVSLGETMVLPETWLRLPGGGSASGTRDVCVRATFVPMRSDSGLVEKVHIKVEDCTRRKKLEEDQHRLRAAINGARQVICEMDPATGRMAVDLQVAEARDEDSGSAGSGRLVDFEKLVHSQDREELLQLIRGQASAEGTYLEHRFRARPEPGGDWRWIQFRGKAFAAPSGEGSMPIVPGQENLPVSPAGRNCTMLVGTMLDITEEHEREVQLRESEEQYRSVFANAAEGMYLLRPDDSIICVNQAFAELLGYDSPRDFENDSRANNFSRIFHIPGFREARHASLLEKGEIRQQEAQVRRRDGAVIWVLENARAIRDDQGRPLYYEGSLIDITERKKNEERLLHQALYDHHTNLPNRSFFMDKLHQGLKRAAADHDYSFGLLCFNLDGFGVVNDSFGHMAGDRLLLEVSGRVQELLGPEDILARFSSDEFSIMHQGSGAEDLQDLAEKVRKKLEEPFLIEGHQVEITASIGVLPCNSAYIRPEDMLRDAELAMHEAKKQGRNRWVVFASEMYEQKSRRTLMEKDLRRALDREELFLQYQPLVSLETGELSGMEALIRWQHPEHGLVSPGEFIPLAEETGLIEPIGDWVLLESFRKVKAWLEFNSSLIVNVNISGKQLEKPGLEGRIYQILQEVNLDPGCVNLEVTESVAISRMDANIRTLKRLKYMGLKLSIDDFGTGYSSLAHLQRFPLDELKIDRAFVNSIHESRKSYSIVQTIVDLARALNLRMVAEGLETSAQVEQFKAFGCHYGQGYLFSRPLVPEVFVKKWLDPKGECEGLQFSRQLCLGGSREESSSG